MLSPQNKQDNYEKPRSQQEKEKQQGIAEIIQDRNHSKTIKPRIKEKLYGKIM